MKLCRAGVLSNYATKTDEITSVTLQSSSRGRVVQTLDNPYYELIGYFVYLCHGDGQTATSVPHHHTLPS